MAKFNLTVLVKLKNIITISITNFIHQYDGFISLSLHCIGLARLFESIPIPPVSHLQVTATHEITRQCTHRTSEAACWSCIQAANLQQASTRENPSASRHILAGSSLITAGLETELCGGDRRFLAVCQDARHGGCESTRPATQLILFSPGEFS